MKRALETVFGPEGRSVVGDALYTDDHPIVAAHPEWFTDVVEDRQAPIESATARPGERRAVTPRVKH